MRENFSAVIGAKISEFRKKMAQVDRIVKRTAMETVKPIGANINRFRKQMAKVEAINKLLLKRSDKTIGADIREFMRKASLVAAATRALNKRVIIDIDARVNNFQRVIGKIANTIRSVDTVLLNGIGGSLVAMIPALVPMIAGLTGVIAMLGNMIGVVSGSTFALVSALFFAGTAALAFGAIAIPTIMKVFGETEKLTKAQAAARAEFDKFTDTYKDIVKSLEQPVLDAFSKAMKIATRLLEMSRPLFEASATTMNNLLDAFNRTLDSKPMIAFFDYMNKAAGPLFEQVMKGIGWMVQGLLNMFVAFGPLAEATAQGFTDMNKRFADWAGNLGSNKGFQAFVDYVQENMPKVRAIFRDMISGTIRLFAAFSGQSGEMIDGFADMMARYKDWASNLGDNKQFQTFLDYIRKTGPGVLKFLGNFIKFIVNIGIGMAPLGAWLIKIANNFFEWANSMMKANPIIGMIFAAIVSLTGVFIALVPFLVAMKVLFAGFGKTLMKGVGKPLKFVAGLLKDFRGTFSKASSFIVRFGTKILPVLGRAFVFLTGPIGLIIAIVLTLIGIFRKLYKTNVEFRNKVNNAFDTVRSKIKQATDALKNTFGPAFREIKEAAMPLFEAIREGLRKIGKVASDVWSKFGDLVNKAMDTGLKRTAEGWKKIEKVISFTWGVISEVVKVSTDLIVGFLKSVTALLKGDWSKAWDIAKDTVVKTVSRLSEKVSELKDKIRTKFEEMKDKALEKLAELVDGAVKKMGDLKEKAMAKIDNWKTSLIQWFQSIPSTIAQQLAKWGSAIVEWTEEQNEENKRQFKAWGETISDWFSSIPEKISSKLEEWKNTITDWFAQQAINIGIKLNEWWTTISDWFTSIPVKIAMKLGEWWTAISEWFDDLPTKTLVKLAAWWSNISEWFQSIPSKISNALESWWQVIKDWFTGVPNKPEVKNMGKNMVDKIAEGNEEKKQEFIDKLGKIIVDVAGAALMIAGVALLAAGRELIKRLIEGIQNQKSSLGSKMDEMGATIRDKIKAIDLKQIGKDIVAGLVKGIASQAYSVYQAIKSLADNIPAWLKSFLGIASPSKVMEKLSQWIPKGVASGITSNLNTIKSAMSKVKDATMFEPEQTNLSFGSAIDQGIQAIKHELEVTLNSLTGDTPVAAGGISNTYNNERLLEGAIFQVREEADIEKLAKKLGDYTKHQSKARGAGR